MNNEMERERVVPKVRSKVSERARNLEYYKSKSSKPPESGQFSDTKESEKLKQKAKEEEDGEKRLAIKSERKMEQQSKDKF